MRLPTLFVLIVLLLPQGSLFAQADTRDTLPPSYIYVDRAVEAEFINANGENLRKLSGEVIMHQDTVFMFCDTAFLWEKRAKMTGNVIIRQGDSLTVFADSLEYESDLRKARLFGDVILKYNEKELHTHRLDYDLRQKKAYYTSGAVLKDGASKLYSKTGHFYIKENTIYFKDSVSIRHPDFDLTTDTLAFNTEERRAYFLAPTLIRQGQALIYCEDGYYDLKTGDAEFRKNAQYKKNAQEAAADTIRYEKAQGAITLSGHAHFEEGHQRATADKIIYLDDSDITILDGHAEFRDSLQTVRGDYLEYDSKTKNFRSKGRSFVSDPPNLLEADRLDYDKESGIGHATGRVIWQDTSRNLAVHCDSADYFKAKDYLRAWGGRPLLINVLEGDSLFLRSDSLEMMRQINDGDTTQLMKAYYNVRMYKSDMQAVCDSLVYTSADSSFYFFYEPAVWADTTQFTADTIRIRMRNDKVDEIHLKKKAFLINSEDLVLFNQVSGKEVRAYFQDNQLHHSLVSGNAKSVYYALDKEKGYIGINKVEASKMKIFFENNEVIRIRYYTQPKGEMYPMEGVNPQDYLLPGFKWQTERRPLSKDDL